MVISIMISFPCWKKLETNCALSFNFAKIIPTIKAKTIICSISPFAKEAIGLVGIIFKIVSTKDKSVFVAELSMVVFTFSTALISKPKPGLIKEATLKATATASIVVQI